MECLLSQYLIIKKNKSSNYSFYIHNSYRANIGKIISLLEYSCNKKDNEVETLSKNLCMHIAALNPKSVSESDLDNTVILSEKDKNAPFFGEYKLNPTM